MGCHVTLVHTLLASCWVHLFVEMDLMVATNDNFVLEFQLIEEFAELYDVIHFAVDSKIASVNEYVSLLVR